MQDIHGCVQVCVKTDIGPKRLQNEDCYLVITGTGRRYDTRAHGMMFAVADGLGGHAAGETASRMACDGLSNYYTQEIHAQGALSPFEFRLRHLERIVRSTHEKIHRYAEDNEGYANMGTTLSALVLFKDKALIAHVGDTRIYRFRNGSLDQLTVDDTVAQFLIESGDFKPDEASEHPLRHVLTQAMGGGLEEIQTRIEEVKARDTFLLCSDGLYDSLTDQQISEILKLDHAGQVVCDRLVNMALEKGASDNVTVVVVQV